MDQNKEVAEEMNSYVEKAFAAKRNCQKILDAAHSQFPALEGKSERQIKYAEDLREKWTKFHTIEIDRYFQIKAKCTPEKIKILADTKFNGDVEKALDYVFDQYQIKTARFVFEETRASWIIDELKY